ncbi:hypothetical protein [Providencia phage PSTRCR_127]|nr:hypothetical protein [Providencia phage PSTRCR_127]QQV89108.1 hypothetical protein [Providencia phage PSTRCR_121]UGO50282.1 hypothetical protein RGZ1_265 [Morganella phage vB_MmoM_Rgz1]
MTISHIVVQVADYEYFKETCLDAYNITEVSRNMQEITIKGPYQEILKYLTHEYCLGMDSESIQETRNSIY